MNNFETRMLIENMKSEMNSFKSVIRSEIDTFKSEIRLLILNKKESSSESVAEVLSMISTDIRNDLAALKKRQDQLFQKQDQIQCTLAGETPPVSSYGFRSPSSSSVLAWLSVSAHAPSQIHSSHHNPASVTGMTQKHAPPAIPAEEPSDYLYHLNELSSMLDEDPYQSSLSDVTGTKSNLGPMFLEESMSEPVAIQPSQQIPRALDCGRPLSEPLVGGFPPLIHPPISSPAPNLTTIFQSTPFQSSTPKSASLQPVTPQCTAASQSTALQYTASTAGNPASIELLPPRKKSRVDIRPEDSGHSSSLKDPQLIVKKYADLANVVDMGKLACVLARQSYFGDDVLKLSTLYGKSAQYNALNPQKLAALLATIHGLPEFKQEFNLLCMPKINSSLSRLCTNLRKM